MPGGPCFFETRGAGAFQLVFRHQNERGPFPDEEVLVRDSSGSRKMDRRASGLVSLYLRRQAIVSTGLMPSLARTASTRSAANRAKLNSLALSNPLVRNAVTKASSVQIFFSA